MEIDYFGDGQIHQKYYGVCQSLSAINSLLDTPEGRERLNSLIVVGADGSYGLALKGMEHIKFSADELAADKYASEYSLGLRIFEKVLIKHYANNDVLFMDVMSMITGNQSFVIPFKYKNKLHDWSKNNAGDLMFNAVINPAMIGSKAPRVINGVDYPLSHAYSVEIIRAEDGSSLYKIENPHNTVAATIISEQQFKENFHHLIACPRIGHTPDETMVKNEIAAARLASKHLFEFAGANAVLLPWDPLRKDLYFEGRSSSDITKAVFKDALEIVNGIIGYFFDMVDIKRMDIADNLRPNKFQTPKNNFTNFPIGIKR